MKAHSTSSAGPTNVYAIRLRSTTRRVDDAATTRRAATTSANGELPLTCLFGGGLSVFHHLLRGLAAGEDALQPLVERLLDRWREDHAGGAGRLELQEFGVERVFQLGGLPRERLRVDRAVRRDPE